MAAHDPFLTLHVTPHGQLAAAREDAAPPIDAETAQRLDIAFAEGAGPGLLQLGASEIETPLPGVFAFWRAFAGRYVTAVCHSSNGAGHQPIAPPTSDVLTAIAAGAPPMTGLEDLNTQVLTDLWTALDDAFHDAFAASHQPLQAFLHDLHPAWSVIGRVHFNLAEYKLDPETPFAFLATYTASLSASGVAQHAPLGRALVEYAGEANRSQLLALLLPLQRAAETCPWLKAMVDNGDVFHPLQWTAADAYQFLQAVPQFEAAGLIVRLPKAWRTGRPPRPRATATIGTKAPSGVGVEALLDFQMAVTLDGETLTKDEIASLLSGTDGLHFVRGRWVEVKREALERMIGEFERVDRLSKANGISFAEAMRLVAGARPGESALESATTREWSEVATGSWLRETLARLRSPGGLNDGSIDFGPNFHATLRPYQEVGVQWMRLLSSLGLGACLSDDMGLGKTVQVLALIVWRSIQAPSHDSAERRRPTLIVAPASLVANWTSEMARFTPALRVLVAHQSAMPRADLLALDPATFARDLDVVITTYGTLLRVPWIAAAHWDLAVLDEAQAIKNPGARQTRAAKMLHARAHIAMTGTPVENRLTDLWSIFDAINPGLLGTHQTFARWTKSMAAAPQPTFGPLRELVRPYILRRMKTDPNVIQDLPLKTEVRAFCPLSPRQAALYQQTVDEMAHRLATVAAIERRGMVLSYLVRFKQIANHPSQWLGDGRWAEADSGKFRRLREITETIAARQEKVLVFTQFREITGALATLLGSVFGRPGAVLHGGTPVAQRRTIVKRFQEDEATPFFVLSLKAGGTGLNLTAATHVIHFDRWWNPAVEDQATDRAFRIGQTQPVLVHKFLCRGTVEEKIDELITSKRRLSDELLAGGGSAELALTEMSDDELLRLVALDINRAAAEK